MQTKNLHIWINSILMMVVTFFLSKNYDRAMADHEKLADHETRITVLESKDREEKRTGMIYWRDQAILPNKEKDKKKQL